MKFCVFIASLFFGSLPLFAQKYLTPPVIAADGIMLTIEDMVKADEVYKFKLVIDNTTADHFAAYSIKQTYFNFPGAGKVAPDGRDKLIMVGPHDKKSVVISVKVPAQSYFPNFGLELNGLYTGMQPDAPISEEVITFVVDETRTVKYGNTEIEVAGVALKKGKTYISTKITLEGSLSNPKELLVYDPAQLSFEAGTLESAESAYIEYPGGSKKLSIALASAPVEIPCAFGKAFRVVQIAPKALEEVTISDGSAPPPAKPTTSHPLPQKEEPFTVNNGCGSHTANTSGTTTVHVSSEVGCFEFFLMGEKLTPQSVSTLAFQTNSSAKKVKVVLGNGAVIEKTILIGEGYSAVYYVIEQRNDKYILNDKPFSAELATGNNQGGGNNGSQGSRDERDYDLCRMSNSSFSSLKVTIEQESFDSGKLQIAKHAANNSCLSASQIRQITQLFSFSAQQLEFAKAAYGNCLNKGSYYEVIGVFTFEKDKKELENYIQNY